MITVCLLSKSQSNHVLQVQNAGEGVCLPNVSDKKNLSSFPVWGLLFPSSPLPLTCEPPASSSSKRGTLTCRVEGCQEFETNTYISGTPESCKRAVYRAAIVLY